MSKGACIAIGIASLAIGSCFIALGAALGAAMPKGPLPFYVLGLFCCVVAAACLLPGSRRVTLRIVRATICGVYVCYVLSELGNPIKMGKADIIGAVAGFLVFGLPGGYLAVTGRYPVWGRYGHVLQGDEPEDPRANGHRGGGD
jgi:hypothetical protein